MAITLQPKFPIPDRSKRTVYLHKDEDGVLDIGWSEGVLSDGRPFRAEMWAQDQISMLTIFFSTIGMGNLDNAAIRQFVVNERLVSFKDGLQYCTSLKFMDDAENELWSVNIVCAAPLREVLTPCRGQRPDHVQRDRVGTWEVSGLAVSVA